MTNDYNGGIERAAMIVEAFKHLMPDQAKALDTIAVAVRALSLSDARIASPTVAARCPRCELDAPGHAIWCHLKPWEAT